MWILRHSPHNACLHIRRIIFTFVLCQLGAFRPHWTHHSFIELVVLMGAEHLTVFTVLKCKTFIQSWNEFSIISYYNLTLMQMRVRVCVCAHVYAGVCIRERTAHFGTNNTFDETYVAVSLCIVYANIVWGYVDIQRSLARVWMNGKPMRPTFQSPHRLMECEWSGAVESRSADESAAQSTSYTYSYDGVPNPSALYLLCSNTLVCVQASASAMLAASATVFSLSSSPSSLNLHTHIVCMRNLRGRSEGPKRRRATLMCTHTHTHTYTYATNDTSNPSLGSNGFCALCARSHQHRTSCSTIFANAQLESNIHSFRIILNAHTCTPYAITLVSVLVYVYICVRVCI